MKIRMVEERTGPRWDARAWPPVGGEIDVDDAEGAAVCGAGWAIPVPQDAKVETRGAQSAPEAPAPSGDTKPGASDPKASRSRAG